MTGTSDSPVRLVLHPGHPKCGSSSIQHALRTNRESLRSRGVFYPPRRPNRIFIRACDREEWEPVERWLSELLRDVRSAECETLVISSENLGVRQLVQTGRPLHEIFATHCDPVDVIYYLRRQDDWMVSMWQQWGHKKGQDLTGFVDDRLGFHEPGYRAATRLFEEVYGPDRVTVRPLLPAALRGEDLVADFEHRAQIGDLPVRDHQHRNPSMSGFLCDVLARVPEVYDQSEVAKVAKGRTDHSVRERLEGRVSRRLLFNRDKRVMSLSERRRIQDHFEEDNRALHARYFDDVPFDDIFGVPGPSDDERLEELRAKVDGLEDVVAMQMQVILGLLEERESPAWTDRVRRVLRRAKRRLVGARKRV